MNLLYYKWNGYMQNDLIAHLRQLGHSVDVIQYVFHSDRVSDTDTFFEKKFHRFLSGRQVDAMISFNFFPVISKLCEQYHIPYLSWIHDSPSPTLLGLEYPCNHVFFFDRYEYQQLVGQYPDNVHHLPLAVDIDRLNTLVPTPEQIEKYTGDVSFVGSLYQQRQNPFQEKTCRDRTKMLQILSHHFPVKLYTLYDTDTSEFPQVILQGPVNYYREMPLVFRLSKINVNLTLSSIRSGIPLRILDIMGAGGFLLTNHQSELDEHFVDGEDLVLYRDFDDMVTKAAYYLSHETERAKIALSGQQKVRLYYNYPGKIQQMFQTVGLN